MRLECALAKLKRSVLSVILLHWLQSFIHSIQCPCLSEQLPKYQTVPGEEASEVWHPCESVVGIWCEIPLVFENTAAFLTSTV